MRKHILLTTTILSVASLALFWTMYFIYNNMKNAVVSPVLTEDVSIDFLNWLRPLVIAIIIAICLLACAWIGYEIYKRKKHTIVDDKLKKHIESRPTHIHSGNSIQHRSTKKTETKKGK
ncbi:MAG: hypothetical protein LBV22_01905 [Mycoplasmataceae bacterium]|jgi:putative effector of murein hydrolase|nr:hypothetical protein [Mycoplasmataceae bacterium]